MEQSLRFLLWQMSLCSHALVDIEPRGNSPNTSLSMLNYTPLSIIATSIDQSSSFPIQIPRTSFFDVGLVGEKNNNFVNVYQ